MRKPDLILLMALGRGDAGLDSQDFRAQQLGETRCHGHGLRLFIPSLIVFRQVSQCPLVLVQPSYARRVACLREDQ